MSKGDELSLKTELKKAAAKRVRAHVQAEGVETVTSRVIVGDEWSEADAQGVRRG